MKVSDEFLKKLFHVGCATGVAGFHEECRTIMQAIIKFQPENVSAWVLLAISSICLGDRDETIRIIRQEVLTRDPQNSDAKCTLALALKRSGDDWQAKALLDEVFATGSENNKEVAKDLLAEMAA